MPTEAEWEYAAKGGDIPTNKIYAGSNSIRQVAWYEKNSGIKTHPVKTRKPNSMKFYDLTGNVWEWCYDWYYKSYPTDTLTDYLGHENGKERVARGGSWYSDPTKCRNTHRSKVRPHDGFSSVGFRVAYTR